MLELRAATSLARLWAAQGANGGAAAADAHLSRLRRGVRHPRSRGCRHTAGALSEQICAGIARSVPPDNGRRSRCAAPGTRCWPTATTRACSVRRPERPPCRTRSPWGRRGRSHPWRRGWRGRPTRERRAFGCRDEARELLRLLDVPQQHVALQPGERAFLGRQVGERQALASTLKPVESQHSPSLQPLPRNAACASFSLFQNCAMFGLARTASARMTSQLAYIASMSV